jgi:catechol 2,3-dioxygenase-like lactoylglutathione lyase family enzyme
MAFTPSRAIDYDRFRDDEESSRMLDHIGVSVSNYEKSKRFYAAALAPLGYAVVVEFGGDAVGLGVGERADFWLSQGASVAPAHFAFAAGDRASVDAFHRAAIEAGGRDNGAPGVRAQYHPTYYGAFVLDPDGNNVEAVCHAPA